MTIFGKSLSEYVSFEKGFLILILVVGLARLILPVLGGPNSIAKFLSLTVLLLLGMIFYSVRVYTSRFGSYKQLLPVLALPVILSQCIIIAGIIIGILTGKNNIFTAPEFSPGMVDGKTWGHAAGHVVAMIVVPLLLWLVGSLIMLVTRKITGGGHQEGAAGASTQPN